MFKPITSISELPEYGILIQSRSHHPNELPSDHAHEFPSLLIIVSGQGICHLGGKEYKLSANTALALPAWQSHRIIDVPGKPLTLFTVYYQKRISDLHDELINRFYQKTTLIQLELFYTEEVRHLIRQMLFELKNQPPGFKMALQEQMSLLLLQLYRAKLHGDRWHEYEESYPSSQTRVCAVLDYIAEHYYRHYDLGNAAHMSGMSQRHFSNLCRKITGKSYIQYLNDVRTQKAESLLVETGMPVSAIAFEVGYEDLSTFYRAFKKHRQKNPLDFRMESS